MIDGKSSVAQSLSIFGNAVPNNPVEADYAPVTLGVKFTSTQAGQITGVRFYRARSSPTGYTVKLFTGDGAARLARAIVAQDTCEVPCWEEVNFLAPVSINANTRYVATYYTPNGSYADDQNGFLSNVTTGALSDSSSGGNGVYLYAYSGLPTESWNASNYFVDVLFTPSTPSLPLSVNPPSPTIAASAQLGDLVATITASWSDGSPFTGTLSFGPPYSNAHGRFAVLGNSLIIDPTGPGVAADGDATQNVTIVATQGDGSAASLKGRR
jgi:hypothetical protein